MNDLFTTSKCDLIDPPHFLIDKIEAQGSLKDLRMDVMCHTTFPEALSCGSCMIKDCPNSCLQNEVLCSRHYKKYVLELDS